MSLVVPEVVRIPNWLAIDELVNSYASVALRS
jgi:hypothetical protein